MTPDQLRAYIPAGDEPSDHKPGDTLDQHWAEMPRGPR